MKLNCLLACLFVCLFVCLFNFGRSREWKDSAKITVEPHYSHHPRRECTANGDDEKVPLFYILLLSIALQLLATDGDLSFFHTGLAAVDGIL